MPHPKVFNPQSLLYVTIDKGTIQLVSILGVGAYGVVYLGRNTVTQQCHAVKLLTHLHVSYKEADIHAYLSGHPNILRFEKLVCEEYGTFMVIEYRPEGDLFAAITKNHRGIVGNNDAIRYIFLQILEAVQYCHQNNIAHRDLKPENIMLTSKWQVKLADFGLATTNPVSDEFGCGSTFYFSPECQGSTNVKGYSTQKNDIWSLGVILINLTAGRNPWKQANMRNSTFAAYVRNPRHFFRTILPCISEELERILLRIFCLDPARRISLPELKIHIQKCVSFVHQPKDQQSLMMTQPKIKRTAVHPNLIPKSMCYSNSVAETMLHYVANFTDDDGILI